MPVGPVLKIEEHGSTLHAILREIYDKAHLNDVFVVYDFPSWVM